MPRPERPLDPSAGPVQAFAAELRRLRVEAGNPKYLQMARMTGRSRTALSEAAGGDHLPTWETTEAFVRACDGDVDAWRIEWERVQGRSNGLIDPPLATRPAAESIVERRVQQRVSQSPDSADVLLRMWGEQRAQGRQSENHRAIITILVVIGAIGGLGYVAVQKDNGLDSVVAWGVCALGLFGALVSAKYFERFKMHMDAAQRLRKRLDALFPELFIEDDWLANRLSHERNYKLLSRIRLEHLWVIGHLGIATLGAAVAIIEVARV
ncbi:helix-turn-helix domain-containing protein [Nocardia amamiensis]|uniref:helix-turn-helix domain-containing protein n=1 Tax=Nocardia amamiensis TaxID=404578 RepID=UPI000AB2097F|nr:helix-turn-helix transcriptional regulator [Nocardia amamiensis]